MQFLILSYVIFSLWQPEVSSPLRFLIEGGGEHPPDRWKKDKVETLLCLILDASALCIIRLNIEIIKSET